MAALKTVVSEVTDLLNSHTADWPATAWEVDGKFLAKPHGIVLTCRMVQEDDERSRTSSDNT